MTLAEARGRDGILIPGVHRVIRQLDADEGPYAGALVTSGESVAVQVDCDALSGWAGWEHAGDEHVAGPVDLVRRSGGHDALLPWCPERVEALVVRRAAADGALSAGEVTTIAVSLLRGLGELGDAGGDASGDWWLTDDGRPMFVIGAGDDARIATTTLLHRIQRGCADRALNRLLSEIMAGLQKSLARPVTPTRQLERWEGELLAIAAPRPLTRVTHAPERARDVDVARRVIAAPEKSRATRRDALSRAHHQGSVPLRARLWDALGTGLVRSRAALGARWIRRRPAGERREEIPGSDGASTATTPHDGGRPLRRGRRVIVAGAAAVVVLGGGLLWPGGETGGQADAPGRPSAVEKAEAHAGAGDTESAGDARSASPAPPTSSVPSDGMPTADDPLTAAGVLLAMIGRCAEKGDSICPAAVAEGSSGIVDALTRGGSGGARPELTPVDEYGDVAVIRVSTPSHSEDGATPGTRVQMVVLVRVDEKWLVRDAYDVADQPG